MSTELLSDLREGAAKRDLWQMLAGRDIANRYQRTFLGPLWITLSTLVFTLAIGVLYSGLFAIEPSSYLPYLTASYIVWILISTTLLEMSSSLTANLHFILNLPGPLSVYFFRTVLRNLWVLAHNLPALAVVALIAPFQVGLSAFLALPGLVIVIFSLLSWGIGLALISTRFRDFTAILASGLQILFFLTPVMWSIDQVPATLANLSLLNPLSSLIAIIRDPVLGVLPGFHVWSIAVSFLVAGFVFAELMYSRFRSRVEYWL